MPGEHLLAIEIGGTKLQLFVGRGDGTIVERRQFPVIPADGAAGIQNQLAAELPRLCRDFAASAIGVGFGGPVEWNSGRVACSHQVAGWSEFPLSKWLNGLTGLPAFVDNDTNVGALGEAVCGAGRGLSPVFYANFGSGVGGGLVIAGSIYHGAPPGEMEFGHLRLDRSGATVEDRCSGWAVDRRIGTQVAEHPESALAHLVATHSGPAAQCLPAALTAGDAVAAEIFQQVTADIAFALSDVVHLLHPAVIVLGGGLSQWGTILTQAVADRLPGYLMESFRPGPSLRLSELGGDVVPVGALLLAESRRH